MPRPQVNLYEKETANMSLQEKLNFYLEKRNYNAIAATIIASEKKSLKGQSQDSLNIKQNFLLNKLCKPLPPHEGVDKEGKKITIYNQADPENMKHIYGIYRAISVMGRYAIMDVHGKINEYDDQIKNGQIKNTELIKNDKKLRRKVAHDITIVREEDLAGETIVISNSASLVLSQLLTSAPIMVDGKPKTFSLMLDDKKSPVDVCKNLDTEVFNEFLKEEKLSEDQFFEISEEANNSNTSENYIGFKVKSGEVKQGESIFERLPGYVTDINKCKSEAELEELENSIRAKVDAYTNYNRQIKASAKVSKSLWEKFKDIDFPDKGSINYGDVKNTLEHYTHIGSDYKLKYDNFDSTMVKVSEKNLGATSLINHEIVDNATHRLGRSIEDLFSIANDKYADLEEAGKTDTEEFKNYKNMALTCKEVYHLNETAKSYDKSYLDFQGEKNGGNGYINALEKELEYINIARKQKGYTVLHEAQGDEYTRFIDDTLDELYDSLVDCHISPATEHNKYEDLSKSLMKNKMIYKKYLAAKELGDDGLVKKYASEFEKNIADTNKLVSGSKEFEDNYANTVGVTKGEINRVPLLKSISTNMKTVLSSVKESAAEVSYEKYIRLHAGKNSGKTVGEKKQNIAKVMAAYTLMKENKKFDLKLLHNTAKAIEEFYCIKDNPDYDINNGGKNRLLDATKNPASMIKEATNICVDLYGIKGGEYENYIKDMKTLKDSMWTAEGRSREYETLCKAINEASELDNTTKGMNAEKKADAFAQANIKVVVAVQKYVKGKETVRISDKGNDAFANSMDALAIVSQYTKYDGRAMNASVAKLVNKICEKRGDNWLNNLSRFEARFGAKRAADAYKTRIKPKLDRKNVKKNKSTNKKTTEAKKPGKGM